VVESEEAGIQATGTDDAQPDKDLRQRSGQHFGQQLGGETVQNVASGGESASKITGEVDKAQVITLSRNKHRRQPLAAAGERGPDRSRTDDGGFAIQYDHAYTYRNGCKVVVFPRKTRFRIRATLG
jgi:hypothetical protein